MFKKRSTTETQLEKHSNQLTALIKKAQHDAFQSQMQTLTENLVLWPTLFSALLVDVVYYLGREDQSSLRSQFYSDLIKYTAPQHLADCLNKQLNDELWRCILKEIASSGDSITTIPYTSKKTFIDMKKGPRSGTAGLEWKTMVYQHNYCLIMRYSLKVRVALAVTELSGCDLQQCEMKINQTISAIWRQSKETNPLCYKTFKASLMDSS